MNSNFFINQSHLDNINQTRNTTVKIENDLKYVKDPKDSKLSPTSSTKLEETPKKNISTSKNTPSESLNENLTSTSNVEQITTNNDGASNNNDIASANPDVRQRRLQHFQTNSTSQ